MQLLKSIYKDAAGNVWEIQYHTLASVNKKRGMYKFWTAECKSLDKDLRADLKRELIKKIKELIQNQSNGTQTKL